MDEEDLIGVAIILLFGICFFASLASPLIAMKKGYAPYYWLLTCGPVGFLIILSQPSLKSAKNPEEVERLENQANFAGSILSCIGVCIAMIPVVWTISSWFRPPMMPPVVSPTPKFESNETH